MLIHFSFLSLPLFSPSCSLSSCLYFLFKSISLSLAFLSSPLLPSILSLPFHTFPLLLPSIHPSLPPVLPSSLPFQRPVQRWDMLTEFPWDSPLRSTSPASLGWPAPHNPAGGQVEIYSSFPLPVVFLRLVVGEQQGSDSIGFPEIFQGTFSFTVGIIYLAQTARKFWASSHLEVIDDWSCPIHISLATAEAVLWAVSWVILTPFPSSVLIWVQMIHSQAQTHSWQQLPGNIAFLDFDTSSNSEWNLSDIYCIEIPLWSPTLLA